MHERLAFALFLFACAENGPSMPGPRPGPESDDDPIEGFDAGPRSTARDAGFAPSRLDADFPEDEEPTDEDGGLDDDPSDPPIAFCRSTAECAAGESCCAIDPESPEMLCFPFPTCPDLSE
jgi:hypothetical protein